MSSRESGGGLEQGSASGGVEGERRWRRGRAAVALRASGESEVSGGVVEGERSWPRAGISEQWCRGRATVPSRENSKPEVSRGAVEGERRWPRPSSRDQRQWRRGRLAMASRATGGGVE
ncbi:hypothetical protein ACJRO7_014514 [Eucalyptus globulus]|uniref:Uncharacterized protein n=1 Tax=Eucalyptus globulus TaxID=34317 RepID=A0ABD3L1E7_EUCGL